MLLPVQAKELGVRTVIIDGPDSWSQTLQDEKMIEKFIGIDFSDADTVFDKCLAAVKKIKKVSQHMMPLSSKCFSLTCSCHYCVQQAGLAAYRVCMQSTHDVNDHMAVNADLGAQHVSFRVISFYQKRLCALVSAYV